MLLAEYRSRDDRIVTTVRVIPMCQVGLGEQHCGFLGSIFQICSNSLILSPPRYITSSEKLDKYVFSVYALN